MSAYQQTTATTTQPGMGTYNTDSVSAIRGEEPAPRARRVAAVWKRPILPASFYHPRDVQQALMAKQRQMETTTGGATQTKQELPLSVIPPGVAPSQVR
jgi:hypothetical protein